MTYHACVWIDQQQAKIFEITAKDVAASHVADAKPHHHLHHATGHADTVMLAEVASKLKTAKAILIVGPGQAKLAFKHYLDAHNPDIAKNVWDVQASDHPSDAQVVAAARNWFHAQDKMH
jgi:stalled ribosome rescue protein Dom34